MIIILALIAGTIAVMFYSIVNDEALNNYDNEDNW
jgi:hypothetical protein